MSATHFVFPSIMRIRARPAAAVTVLGLAALLTACSSVPQSSSALYTRGQAQREQIVRLGTVESVRPVMIQSEDSNVMGTIAGGALGGAVGNTIGGGSGRTIATVGGAILGGIAGNLAEEHLTRTQGLEITVRLDNGETRVVAQAADIAFSAGQRVRLISGGGPARVAPL